MSEQVFNKTNIFIALQYLAARKKQSFLATIGVLLGVTTFIVMINFMTGVNDFLDDAVFNGSPDIIISATTKRNSKKKPGITTNYIENSDKVDEFLEKDQNVESFAHQIISPAILISDAKQFPGSINGIFPDQEDEMVDLERRLIEGEGFQSLSSENTILLGISLAKRLQVSAGDQIKMILPNGKNIVLKVSGIFSFGITTIDNVRTYVSAATLQNLLGQNSISNIHIKLRNRDNVRLKDYLIQNINDITTEDWKDSNKTIVIGNKVRDILTWSVSFALLLVAGFGIYNILNITVIQKRKDIAVLKTIGYSSKDIVFIFLVQSLIIGILGAFFGAFFGYIISYMISTTPLDTSDFIIVDTYPINFKISYYVLGLLFGILTTIIAGYFPSRKASKVDPVTIIRGI
ncbi:lipoprotein-releasing system permease protein [Aquimarina amphilecti]|uniref:Lipoprotein-releasing system permease protein n=1 Tax=Aquimarina amphilecti TaxID=1038014 RepID=A0A1H7J568_AQUAM|nr:FtsX-like permease family protein [Aquimarina amphilecti]SEK69913.1 lipoprotein-releasing system permease protein [Aquimarina amphilecti]